MSDIIDIDSIRKDFEVLAKQQDSEQFAIAQQTLINKLQKENEVLNQKIKQLEYLLKQNFTLSNKLSAEEMICMEQIDILRSASNNRELSLDEVKRLDLLIKNLRLIREQSTQVINSTDYSNVVEDDLVAIARGETASEQS
jgi:hypothetical protein